MTAADRLEEMIKNIEAGCGIPKEYTFRSQQRGSNAIFEELKASARAQQARANKNRDAYGAATFAAFGCGRPMFDEADLRRAEKADAKHRPRGKMEMLPFGCTEVRGEVHFVGPGVRVRAASFTVASWVAARLNKQHCDGQRQFEITEIQATLIVGQRHLPNAFFTNPSPERTKDNEQH